MPITAFQLSSTPFVVAAPDEPLGALLERLPASRPARFASFVVIAEPGGTFRVLRWQDVEERVRSLPSDPRALPVGQLPQLPEAVPAVDADAIGIQAANELRDEQKPLKVVVVLKAGQVLGLLAQPLRGEQQIDAPDPFPQNHMANALPDDPPMDAEDEAEQGDTPEPQIQPRIQTAPAEGEEASKGVEPEPRAHDTPPEEADEHVINALLKDHAKGQPLAVGTPYTLVFNVDAPQAEALASASAGLGQIFDASPKAKHVEITVVIDSDDLTITGSDQGVIEVPRKGASTKDARFTITPTKDGPSELRALFFANNRMFQKMKLTLHVGAAQAAPIEQQASGKTLQSALASQPRPQEIDLVILRRDAGYEFILNSGGVKRATVNLSEQQIADMTTNAREELKGIVYAKEGGRYLYQSADTSIPAFAHEQSLKALMGIGTDLFEGLFFAPGSGADANEMGRVLREKSRQGKLQIAIIAERFSFPWALLYDRDYDPDHVEPEGFWGFKHVIEYTPEFRTATPMNLTPEISVAGDLEIGFVVNTTIDDELHQKGLQVDVIKPQQEFLRQLPGVKVSEYATKADLISLLRSTQPGPQLLYFYCHAESALPSDPGGVDASQLILSDGPVTLKDLKRLAALSKTEESLQSAPLVFINACESAELSPYFYDGLVPYLIAKGARGVLGTEVNTPALFAAEFARLLLQRFAAGGQPIGELLLDLRREYLMDKNNVMGLVYALHSGAQVVVQRI